MKGQTMTQPEVKISQAIGYDPNFGQLDLSSLPMHLTRADDGTDPFLPDERFAPLDTRGSGIGAKALKEFIAEQVQASEPDSIVKVSSEPFNVFFRDKVWHATGSINEQRHHFTAPTRDAVIGKLVRLSQSRPRSFRELTKAEELQVIRLCQSGDRLSGIGLYLKFAIGDERAEMYESPLDMLADPELVPVCNQCVLFCFYHMSPSAPPPDSVDWLEYLARTIGDRPLTFNLLDNALIGFLDEQVADKRAAVASQLGHTEPEPTAEDFDEMSDQELQAQMRAVTRAAAGR
jgi:hypothetical protein